MSKIDLGQVIDATEIIFRDYEITGGTVNPSGDVFTHVNILLAGYLPYSVACWTTTNNDNLTYTAGISGDDVCTVWIKNRSQIALQYGGYCRIGYKKRGD